MTRTNFFNFGLRTLALTTVCAGLASIASAANPQLPGAADSQVTGIALHDGGVLYGQVVDAQRRPLAKQQVRILSQGRLILATETDAQGRFGVKSLRGGVHTLESRGGSQTVQLWAPHTAPPSAGQVAVVLAGQEVVARGQDDDTRRRRRRLIALGLGGAALGWALDYNPSGS